jgi:hypothetical protein
MKNEERQFTMRLGERKVACNSRLKHLLLADYFLSDYGLGINKFQELQNNWKYCNNLIFITINISYKSYEIIKWKYVDVQVSLYKNSVRTAKKTPHFTVTKTKELTLFKM